MENILLTNYQGYLSSILSLTYEEMEKIYLQMTEGVNADEDAKELFMDVLEQAVSYLQYRSKWILWDKVARSENDSKRTSCHNALITKINVFARYMKSIGYSTEWREALGDENEHSHTRKRIGDFACYMVFINALGAR